MKSDLEEIRRRGQVIIDLANEAIEALGKDDYELVVAKADEVEDVCGGLVNVAAMVWREAGHEVTRRRRRST